MDDQRNNSSAYVFDWNTVMALPVVPINSVPWPPADGALDAALAALVAGGFPAVLHVSPAGIVCSDAATVTSTLNSYTGSASQLAYAKQVKQAALDTLFNANFDLAKFIRGGTATGITAANVGTFLAQITNNYRTLRASIAAAADVATVNAISLNGWPSNP